MLRGDGHGDDDSRGDEWLSREEREQVIQLIDQRKLWRSLHNLLRSPLAATGRETANVAPPAPAPVAAPARASQGAAIRIPTLAPVDRLRADLTLSRVHRSLTHYAPDGAVAYRSRLNPSQTDVLGHLVDAGGGALPASQIAARMEMSEHAVRRIIGQLRELCLDPDWTLIRTVRGVGYALQPGA
ncbi:MAG TPA: helix-turn-helix domain-containing protein [Ktedonobacterales bacterium]